MTARNVERAEWAAFFARVSKGLAGRSVRIEIAGADIGDQVLAEAPALIGLSWEPKSDMLEVALDGLDHMVRHPLRIAVEETAAGLESLEVADAEGRRQILRFREPLHLPAPD